MLAQECREPQHDARYNEYTDEEGTYVFGYGEVERLDFLAVRGYLHDFSGIFAVFAGDAECHVAILVCLSVFHTGRREAVQSVGAHDDYRQWNAVMVVERHFPAVAVAEVLEDNLLGVDFL